MRVIVLGLALLSGIAIPHEAELKETVSAHWTLLAKHDKFAALKNVLPGCENEFINRSMPIILSWNYVEATPLSENEARVRIDVQTIVPRVGPQTLPRIETWVWTGDAWKLKLEKVDASKKIGEVFGAKLPKKLQISPSELKIKFFDSGQITTLRILNGTDQPVEVLSVGVDEKRFEIVSRPDKVAAGQIGGVKIKYKETENEKNRKSQMTLRLRQEGAEKLYEIPILYNYISEADLNVFGLTRERAEAIKHEEKRKLRPILTNPSAASANQVAPPAKPAQP
jgi:hypothetical protein